MSLLRIDMTNHDCRRVIFFFFQAEDGIRDWRDWSSDVCSSDLGYGSGRRGGRATVEGCAWLLALDVKRVMRPVLAAHRDRSFRPGEAMNAGPIRFAWWREGEAEPWAAVDGSLELGPDRGHARLTLEFQAGRRTTGPRDQRVRLEAGPCRFGGVRWWWICPATGRRAAKLY